MKRLLRPLLFAATLALTACAAYGPSGLATGSTEAEVIKKMGSPTGQRSLPEGGKRLEFARGPSGFHTFMLDFDAQGRLQRWDQVLTEENFAKIQPGMDQSDVLALLGRPSEITGYGWHERRNAWSYRYWNSFCQWFQVGVTLEGKVADSAYATDPVCDRRNNGKD
jgi:hypothetical protein